MSNVYLSAAAFRRRCCINLLCGLYKMARDSFGRPGLLPCKVGLRPCSGCFTISNVGRLATYRHPGALSGTRAVGIPWDYVLFRSRGVQDSFAVKLVRIAAKLLVFTHDRAVDMEGGTGRSLSRPPLYSRRGATARHILDHEVFGSASSSLAPTM